MSLNDVIADLQHMLRRTLGEHVRVQTVLDPGLALIAADRGQLEQVLINLAVNARDAMPGGGQLTITTANDQLDDAAAAALPGVCPGPHVRMVVADDGFGMAAGVRERAFEPFFTTKPAGQGTGLGLATVHGIVTQNHGAISVASDPGHGTSFTVLLPCGPALAPAADARPPAVTDTGGGDGRRILIVDDQDALRHAAARILATAGYQVTEADSPGDALRLIAGQRFDLLLSDIVMPEMLGPELADRATATDAGLRVIYMSGYLDPQLELGPRQPESHRVLSKPFTPDQLLSAVATALAQPAG